MCLSTKSKKEYIQRYNGIENKTVQLEENKNKCGRVNTSANHMIVTETVRLIHKPLLDKDFYVSLGSVLNLKPFFVMYASENEMSLCLCELCLKTKFVFDALMSKAKKDGNESFTSITSFLMDGCSCTKGENGYHKWLCSIQKCKDCKDTKPAPLKCSSSKELVTFNQFEAAKKEYKKLNPKTNVLELKTTQLVERVSKQITYEEL